MSERSLIAGDRIKTLVRAARPTLFSAASQPDLIASLVFANLMSESLWRLAGRIAESRRGVFAKRDLHGMMRVIQKFVNGRFYHARHLDFGRIWGLHERERITDHDDLKASDYAMDILERGFRRRLEVYSWAPVVLEFIKRGLFPEYVYPTVDVIMAHGPLLENLSNKPLGMTSCADECILIASAALALGCCRPSEVVLLGSPFHYSLFLFPEGGGGFWFNAKRELFDETSWASLHPGGSRSEIRRNFDERMWIFDRIITLRGHCVFPRGETSLPRAELAGLVEKMERFLGLELVSGAEMDKMTEVPAGTMLPCLEGCASAEEVALRMRELVETANDPLAEASFYSARRLDVSDPGIYVSAGLTAYKMLLRSAEILKVEDAVSMVRNITGRQSVFGTSNRLALPDEIFLFNTADENERVLAFYTLLALSPSLTAEEKESISIHPGRESWSAKFLDVEWTGRDL